MGLLTRIKGKILREWINMVFPHLNNFRKINQGIDCLVLGGQGAYKVFLEKCGYNMSSANLTIEPTSISYMLRIIKNYHSYLKRDGTIFLVIHPLSLCIMHYSNNKYILDDIRYYPILHNALIESYNSKLSKKWSRTYKPQSVNDIKHWIRLALNHYNYKDEMNYVMNILNDNVDNEMRISPNLTDVIKGNIRILCEIKDFSDERGYDCKVIVMKDYFGKRFLNQYGSLLDELCYGPLGKTNMSILQ